MKNIRKLFILLSAPFVLAGCSGEKGPQGEKGDAGIPGKSAYEIYCEYHPEYKKTEQEWIDEFCKSSKETLSLDDFEGKEYYRADISDYNAGECVIYTFSDGSLDGQNVDQDIYTRKIVIKNKHLFDMGYSVSSEKLEYGEEERDFFIVGDFFADDDITFKITEDYFWDDGFYFTVEFAQSLGIQVIDLATLITK